MECCPKYITILRKQILLKPNKKNLHHTKKNLSKHMEFYLAMAIYYLAYYMIIQISFHDGM